MERHHFSVLEQKSLYRGQKVRTQSQDWNIKLCTLFQTQRTCVLKGGVESKMQKQVNTVYF